MTAGPGRFPRSRDVFAVVTATFLLYVGFTLAFGGSESKPVILLMEFSLIVPALLFTLLGHYPFRQVFRLSPVKPGLLAASVPLGLGVGILGDELDRMVQSVVPMPVHILQALKEFMTVDGFAEAALVVGMAVIAAGVVEEMLFRGFLQTSLERSGTPGKAIGATAAVFAFLHFNPWWTFQIFALGIVLGILAWRSRSIWPCVVIHALNNAVSMLFVNLDESRLQWYVYRDHVSPVCFIAGLILTYAGLRLFFRLTGPAAGTASDS
ncbi:CPBP family intramembrane metalloprotease [bacterium]|nr:CPBP family intramembrane metalloprotease [bacterium]